MQATVTLANSSEFILNNEEVFLRGIPNSINVGNLSTDALKLLVFYVSKEGPYKLAVESGFFTGTLEEWLTSLYGSGEGSGMQGPAGAAGKSAYELFLDTLGEAPTVSLEEWLASLKGEAGENGLDGIDGKSAYQLYVDTLAEEDVILTPTEWLASLVGATGQAGEQGPAGLDGAPGEKGDSFTFADFTPEQLASLQGEPGVDGAPGTNGIDGKSAYELYVETLVDVEALSVEDWLLSLKGDKGDTGEQGIQGETGPQGLAFTFDDFTSEHLELLKGEQGIQGEPGPKGDTGLQGPAGPTGDKGDKGDKGDTGAAGADGVTQDATTIVLTGVSLSDATAVTETDTLLVVIGKLQAQIDALTARVSALETPVS